MFLQCLSVHEMVTLCLCKVATHVSIDPIGAKEAIRQTAQGEVTPVMWNGSH